MSDFPNADDMEQFDVPSGHVLPPEGTWIRYSSEGWTYWRKKKPQEPTYTPSPAARVVIKTIDHLTLHPTPGVSRLQVIDQALDAARQQGYDEAMRQGIQNLAPSKVLVDREDLNEAKERLEEMGHHAWADPPSGRSGRGELMTGMTAEKLREIAGWLDTYDRFLEKAVIHYQDGSVKSVREATGIEYSDEVQRDLRRWADELTAPEGKVLVDRADLADLLRDVPPLRRNPPITRLRAALEGEGK